MNPSTSQTPVAADVRPLHSPWESERTKVCCDPPGKAAHEISFWVTLGHLGAMPSPACLNRSELEVGFHPIDAPQRLPKTEADKAMEAASEIRKIAFLGDHLPRNCGVAVFTWGVLFAVQREFLRPKPRFGKGGMIKGKAAA